MSNMNTMDYVKDILGLTKWLVDMDVDEGVEINLEAAFKHAQFIYSQPMSKEMEVF